MKVSKTTFIAEESSKRCLFLNLSPEERLKYHEELVKRIWGDKYNSLVFEGLKVHKKSQK